MKHFQLVLAFVVLQTGCSLEEQVDLRSSGSDSAAESLDLSRPFLDNQFEALCRRSPATKTFYIWTREGLRDYIVYSPKRDCSKQAPALLVFHGGFGTASGAEKISPFHAQADATETIIVYPNGIQKHWNDGRENDDGSLVTTHRDVEFVGKIMDDLETSRVANMRRIYSTGHSNGAMMTMRLACELSTRIAAFASNAGSLPEPLAACDPERPVPFLFINGTNDDYVPYDGSPAKHPAGKVFAVETTIETFAIINECKDQPEVVRLPNLVADGAVSVHYKRSACAGGSKVENIKVIGGGHTWPGSEGSKIPILGTGNLTTDFDASSMIMSFVSQFSL